MEVLTESHRGKKFNLIAVNDRGKSILRKKGPGEKKRLQRRLWGQRGRPSLGDEWLVVGYQPNNNKEKRKTSSTQGGESTPGMERMSPDQEAQTAGSTGQDMELVWAKKKLD